LREILAKVDEPLAASFGAFTAFVEAPTVLARELDVAKLTCCLTARLSLAHSTGEKLPGAHIDMEGQFVVDIRTNARRRAPGESERSLWAHDALSSSR
jgi:hypothetical protein